MTSITRLQTALQRVLIDEAESLARATRVIRRQRKLSGALLLQTLILPPASSGRRQLIDEVAAPACGSHPQASLVIEERSSWVAASQAGMGSFLSYRPVVARLEHVEIRSFQPMRTAMVGFVHRAGPVSAAAAELIRTAQAPGQAAPG